jgi:hypothetical protein
LTFLVLSNKKADMKSRLIIPVTALLCGLFIAAEAGRTAGNIEVSEGPTPFIRFVNTSISNVPGFEFAQFLIMPKTGSATRPIKARYGRSYLEARGYFDPQSGKLNDPDLRSLRRPPKPRYNQPGFQRTISPDAKTCYQHHDACL